MDAYVSEASPERKGAASVSASSSVAALVRDEDFLVLDASKLPLELCVPVCMHAALSPPHPIPPVHVARGLLAPHAPLAVVVVVLLLEGRGGMLAGRSACMQPAR